MLRDNLFQVTGLVASASAKDRRHQATRIRRLLDVSEPLSFEKEILFCGCRRNSITAEKALRSLEDASLRLRHGIFWFTDGAIVDENLLDFIAVQDWSSAFDLTRKVLNRKTYGKGYLSSVSNHATLAMFIATSMQPGTLRPALSAGKWRSKKQAFLDGVKWKALVVARGEKEALIELYGRVSDEMVVQTRSNVVSAFLEGVEEVVAEAMKLGLSLKWGEVIDVLREAGLSSNALESRLIASVRREMDALIRDIKQVDEGSRNAKVIDQLVQLQKAASHILVRIAAVSGETSDQFQFESARVGKALYSKFVGHWKAHMADGSTDKITKDRKRLNGIRELLSELQNMKLELGTATDVENAFNWTIQWITRLDEAEHQRATRLKREKQEKERKKKSQAAAKKRKEEEERRRKRREEAKRQSKKEAEQARKDLEQKRSRERAQGAQGARNAEAKKQGRLEAERMRLERNAPEGIPSWFIDWLVEFESMRWQSRLRRYEHLVRSLPDGGGMSVCDGLWAWARKRKSTDNYFNLPVAMRWCGNQYAMRVIPLLEEMWKMSVHFSSLEATTELVRLQVGKRIRTTSYPVMPVAGSLVDRLDALLADKGECDNKSKSEKRLRGGYNPYEEVSVGDFVGYVIAALFVLWILSMVLS